MRKNLRGFTGHFQRLANELARSEFPGLPEVSVCPTLLKEDTLASYYPPANMIWVNTYRENIRKDYLEMDEERLIEIIRHELVHAYLHQIGKPSGDDDPEFILECLRRKVPVNIPSIAALEEKYGRGSFDIFANFLPPPEVELIPLADGCGVLVKEKWE